MSANPELLIVPDQLTHLVDDHALAVHETWAALSLRGIRQMIPEPTVVDVGDRRVRGVLLPPRDTKNINTDLTVVLDQPHQQAWKESMFIRGGILRDLVAPDSNILILPSDGLRERYSNFTEAEIAEMTKTGNLRAYYEQRTRTVEAYGVKGNVIATGYSKGGLTVLGMGAVGSDQFELKVINSDEAPSFDYPLKATEPKEKDGPAKLKKAFLSSTGPIKHRAAIADARIPALSSALNVPRMGVDYASFGLATFRSLSGAIHVGMSHPEVVGLVEAALAHYPNARIKLGHVVGSYLVDVEAISAIEDERVRVVEYSGDGAHGHMTGDNPLAHGLMLEDAIRA